MPVTLYSLSNAVLLYDVQFRYKVFIYLLCPEVLCQSQGYGLAGLTNIYSGLVIVCEQLVVMKGCVCLRASPQRLLANSLF